MIDKTVPNVAAAVAGIADRSVASVAQNPQWVIDVFF